MYPTGGQNQVMATRIAYTRTIFLQTQSIHVTLITNIHIACNKCAIRHTQQSRDATIIMY
jgi:hypothetical protein